MGASEDNCVDFYESFSIIIVLLFSAAFNSQGSFGIFSCFRAVKQKLSELKITRFGDYVRIINHFYGFMPATIRFNTLDPF
jgi:hypothetical protein